jgi:hypothetical protein
MRASAFAVQGSSPNSEKRLIFFNCDEVSILFSLFPSAAGGFYIRGESYREEETPLELVSLPSTTGRRPQLLT